MWRFDATPRHVAALAGPAPGLLGAAVVAARELHAVAPLRGLRTERSGAVRRMEVVVASGLDAPAAARAAVTAWLPHRSPTRCSMMRSCSSPSS